MASLPPTTFPDGVVAGEIRVDAPLPGRIGWGAYRAQAIRFVRFAIVGGLASIVYLALFAVLVGLGVHYLVAGTIGYLTAIATNFAVNRHWTFGRGIRAIHVQAASFLLVQLLVGVVNLSLLHGFVVAGVRPIILAQLLAAGLLVPVNFLASQRWGFR
jgi:putative flippase GtrA